MGFQDYAWDVSIQKDNLKVKVRMDSNLEYPLLTAIEGGFTVSLPMPYVLEEGEISFLGFQFPQNPVGKAEIGRLFRASVLHLTTHTMIAIPDEKIVPQMQNRSFAESFSESLVRDVYVNTYLQAHHPDRLPDIAFANSLAFAKMKPVDRIFSPATRIMTALLSKYAIGTIKGTLCSEEEETADELSARLGTLGKTILASFSGEQIKFEEKLEDAAYNLVQRLEPYGPFLEAPSFQYTEQISQCSVFAQNEISSGPEIEKAFRKSLATLGYIVPADNPMEAFWRKEMDIEAQQAFDSELHQKNREEKILSKLNEYAAETRLKSVSFPEEDYTQYLRARNLLAGGSRRLLDSLRVAQDAMDEDTGKEMGQLDLTAVIQAVSSKKPATDVFFKDEYLSKSFALSILFDVSASMKVKGELARALAICVSEATKELLMDHGSWTFFAFSDRFYVLKDYSEAYTRKVRARIGGLRFEGLTYMPDAIQIAGQVLAKRFEEQRFLIVISDGWPYGYPDIPTALKECIDNLQKRGVIVVGIGVETDRMQDFFKLSSAVHNQKDLVTRFSRIFTNASATALET